MPNFQGLPTQIISNEFMSLEFLKDAGPRIVRLSAFGKENLFADIPDSVNTQYGKFLYRGGHRIWLTPEALPRTYIPDNERILVEEISDGVCSGPGVILTRDFFRAMDKMVGEKGGNAVYYVYDVPKSPNCSSISVPELFPICAPICIGMK
jgi:hypothetical protein